jgi:hypothetical protein
MIDEIMKESGMFYKNIIFFPKRADLAQDLLSLIQTLSAFP